MKSDQEDPPVGDRVGCRNATACCLRRTLPPRAHSQTRAARRAGWPSVGPPVRVSDGCEARAPYRGHLCPSYEKAVRMDGEVDGTEGTGQERRGQQVGQTVVDNQQKQQEALQVGMPPTDEERVGFEPRIAGARGQGRRQGGGALAQDRQPGGRGVPHGDFVYDTRTTYR